MDAVLEGMGDFAAAYLDDVIIFSNSWNDHSKHLNCVFFRLRQAGLTVKQQKCQFGYI